MIANKDIGLANANLDIKSLIDNILYKEGIDFSPSVEGRVYQLGITKDEIKMLLKGWDVDRFSPARENNYYSFTVLGLSSKGVILDVEAVINLNQLRIEIVEIGRW